MAALKASADLVKAVEAAVRLPEEPSARGMTVSTDRADLRLTPEDCAEAFDAVEPGTAHNEAREQILDELVSLLFDRYTAGGGEDLPYDPFRGSLLEDGEPTSALHRAWPLLEPTDLVGDLWSVPAYLRRCAPRLGREDVARLQRADAQAWTVGDPPLLLDAARRRLGDPAAARHRARNAAAAAAERARMADVIDAILKADDDGEDAVAMLLGQDLRDTLVDESALTAADPDGLAGPFAHVVVDEAQELTDAQWQMLLQRCPSRSFTIVGNRAQARHGCPDSWRERLERVGFDRIELASPGINHRTPHEVMEQAEPVIRSVLPDANVPASIRSSGAPVVHGTVADLDRIIGSWLAEHAEGTACVIGDPAFRTSPRVRSLTPALSKGLEFDLVVLVGPQEFGAGIEGAVDRYVAMTRATRRLVVLTSP